MVIDFHVHTFPEKIAARTLEKLSSVSGVTPSTDGTVCGLLEEMERSSVDLSVILPVVTRPEQFRTINDTAAAINKNYAGKIYSFGGIHPDTQDYRADLEYIKQLGLKGIKLHPDYQQTYIDDEKYLRIVAYASELGLITVVHAGVDVGYPDPVHCTPKRSRNLIDAVHPKKLVLAHMGGFGLWEEAQRFLVGQDVYLDTAFTFEKMGEEAFVRMVRNHGCEKILFATDSPWYAQKEAVEWFCSTALTPEEKALILSYNAKRLLFDTTASDNDLQ